MTNQSEMESTLKDSGLLSQKEIEFLKNITTRATFPGLSQFLIERQNIDQKAIDALSKLHEKKIQIYIAVAARLRTMAKIGFILKDDVLYFNKVNTEIQDLEFQAQKLWKFPEDATYHNWWLDVPGCSCPMMDNSERQGISGRIIDQGCLIHGNRLEKSN